MGLSCQCYKLRDLVLVVLLYQGTEIYFLSNAHFTIVVQALQESYESHSQTYFLFFSYYFAFLFIMFIL